ncbi:MAG: hypothetical protein ACSLE6_06195 [Mycobacterium sp.]
MIEARHVPQLRRLSTPRAAGIAGVLFAILFGIALVMIRTALPAAAEPGTQWDQGAQGRLRLAAILVPFAGIAFLWFIGVVRDGFGKFEDKFFASVFIGSGVLFLAMTFATTAVGVSLLATDSVVTDPELRTAVLMFGQTLMTTLSKTYALRMGAVFMISLATIWLKTGLMPRWLVIVTYVAAAGLLIAGDVSMWLALAFPTWVLVVSVLVLVKAGVIDLHHDD